MTIIVLLLKACLALNAIVTVQCFCRWQDIRSVALPGSVVLFLCFGIWGVP
jgi:hypothetical protein